MPHSHNSRLSLNNLLTRLLLINFTTPIFHMMTQVHPTLLQLPKVSFVIPNERARAREEQVDFLECAVRRLGVERPDERDGEKLTAAKTCRVFSPMRENMTGLRSVSQPLPMLQPKTPHAIPLDRKSVV